MQIDNTEILQEIEFFKSLLRYEPETGQFYWLVNASGRVFAGSRAGSPSKSGHIQIRIKGTNYYAHRLAWLFTHSRWPSDEIDHINHVRGDNRIANLREATRKQNAANTLTRNKHGYRGVYKDPRRAGYFMRISDSDGPGSKRKYIEVGPFNTPEEAHIEYCRWASKMRGDFGTLPSTSGGIPITDFS